MYSLLGVCCVGGDRMMTNTSSTSGLKAEQGVRKICNWFVYRCWEYEVVVTGVAPGGSSGGVRYPR